MVQCSFCGVEIGESQICPYCGAKAPSYNTQTGQKLGGDKGGSEELEKTTKNISKSQFKESMKFFGGTIKNILEGGPQAAAFQIAMEGIGRIFEIFAPVIEILKSPLEVITGIMEMSLVPLIRALVPIMSTLNTTLFQNKEGVMGLITVMSPLFMSVKFLTVVLEENKEEIQALITELVPLIAEFGELALILLEDEDVMFLVITAARALAVELRAIVIAIKFVKGAFEELKSLLSSISLPGLPGGGGGGGGGGNLIPGVDIPFIPGIQAGGLVKANPPFGTVVRMGETEDELAIPSSKMGAFGENPEILYKLDVLIATVKESNMRRRTI